MATVNSENPISHAISGAGRDGRRASRSAITPVHASETSAATAAAAVCALIRR